MSFPFTKNSSSPYPPKSIANSGLINALSAISLYGTPITIGQNLSLVKLEKAN